MCLQIQSKYMILRYKLIDPDNSCVLEWKLPFSFRFIACITMQGKEEHRCSLYLISDILILRSLLLCCSGFYRDLPYKSTCLVRFLENYDISVCYSVIYKIFVVPTLKFIHPFVGLSRLL